MRKKQASKSNDDTKFYEGEDETKSKEIMEDNANLDLDNENPSIANEDNYADNNGSEASQNLDYKFGRKK